MRNNKFNTILLVLLNLSLITGFSYILFTGGLEKAFNNNVKFLPVAVNMTSISKVAPSVSQFQNERGTARSKKHRSIGNNPSDNDFSLPTVSLESFYGNSNSRKYVASRGLSSSSSSASLISTEDGTSSAGSNAGVYAGSRRGGGTQIGGGSTYAGNLPFTNGISTLPRASVPSSGGGTILIDPMTDPLEENRIPVGEGVGIMLLFAAAFVGKISLSKRAF